MSKSEIGRLLKLRTYLDSFKRTDRRSINNSFFIGQHASKIPKVYTDFKSFGRLGVSSFRLNWDYSCLRVNFKDVASLKHQADSHSNFRRAGAVLSKYSPRDLQLVSCFLWGQGSALSSSEKKAAIKIKNDIMKNL